MNEVFLGVACFFNFYGSAECNPPTETPNQQNESAEQSDSQNSESVDQFSKPADEKDVPKGIYAFELIRQQYFPQNSNSVRGFISDLETPLMMGRLQNNFLNSWHHWVTNPTTEENPELTGIMPVSSLYYEEYENTVKSMIETVQKIQPLWNDIEKVQLSVCRKQKSSVPCVQ